MSSRKDKKSATRVVREQMARERRRKRTLWTSLAAVVVLVIAGAIGVAVWSDQKGDSGGDVTAPQGANAAGSGIVTGSGPVKVDVYEDFMCPACARFKATGSQTLQQLAAEGKAEVIYHPVAYLNRYSDTEYSTRAAAAAGCAANDGKYVEYAGALFAQQPAQGSAGLSNDQLIDIGASVGLDRDKFGRCVRDGTYRDWTRHVTDEASRAGVNSIPTVTVDGEELDDISPAAITAAVEEASR